MQAVALASPLSAAYARYDEFVRGRQGLPRAELQRRILGWLKLGALDGLHTIAGYADTASGVQRERAQAVSRIAQRLLDLLEDPPALFESEELRQEFQVAYDDGHGQAFPAATVFLRCCQEIGDLTRSFSLGLVNLEIVRAVDIGAYADTDLADFSHRMARILNSARHIPDAACYSQFYEAYSEARVYLFLRGKVEIARVRESGEPVPDFKCDYNGRLFFIEVKSFDIVGGRLRHDEIMVDAIDTRVILEEQIARGDGIGLTYQIIEPYRHIGEEGSDAFSLKIVIDTLREKISRAFAARQFEAGPTFGLAVVDRLVVPGGASAIAPYYLDGIFGEPRASACVSGPIWHAAFGRVGAPVLRLPRAAGLPSLEGLLDADGVFVDPVGRFPGVGLLTFKSTANAERLYGLFNRGQAPVGDWSAAETESVLAMICDAYNDDLNSAADRLSVYRVD